MIADLAYYNEFDPYAAQWLRNLIDAGHIAPGIVDERSIEDVRPIDLHGFTQCHFFAGIGVWPLALRRAGWPDSRPIWTASCPCQPFSAAGQGAGFADERHLWPHLYHLIDQRHPTVVVGEQVASKDADPWLDLVHTDLEAVGYAFGAIAFPAAGIGAPHIRDRTYWVANANDTRSQGRGGVPERAAECFAGPRGVADGLANPSGIRLPSWPGHGSPGYGDAKQRLGDGGVAGGLADADGTGTQRGCRDDAEATGFSQGKCQPEHGSDVPQRGRADRDGRGDVPRDGLRSDRQRPGPTNGLWGDADWLFCRDGKWRPVEPGTFPLAHGAPARVGRLRAYGNAVNAEAARVWIETVMDCLPV